MANTSVEELAKQRLSPLTEAYVAGVEEIASDLGLSVERVMHLGRAQVTVEKKVSRPVYAPSAFNGFLKNCARERREARSRGDQGSFLVTDLLC